MSAPHRIEKIYLLVINGKPTMAFPFLSDAEAAYDEGVAKFPPPSTYAIAHIPVIWDWDEHQESQHHRNLPIFTTEVGALRLPFTYRGRLLRS